MSKKAWLFLFDYSDGAPVWSCLWAETRGKAKAIAADLMLMDFIDVRVRREKRFDGLHFVTPQQWIDAGYRVQS